MSESKLTKRYLYFDPEKCSACGACALACMDQNDIDCSKGDMPFRNTFVIEDRVGMLGFYSVSCMHCCLLSSAPKNSASCMSGHPTAIRRVLATLGQCKH